MAHQLTTSYILKDSLELFRYYKKLAERAIEQCPDEGLFATLDAESNSIAIDRETPGGQHALALDRFSDYRRREARSQPRHRIRGAAKIARRTSCIVGTWLDMFVRRAGRPLSDADLTRTVLIRTEPHSVMQAINRQVAHYSYHVGQITYLTKHFAAEAGKWTALTVPRKKSAEFNAKVSSGQAFQR